MTDEILPPRPPKRFHWGWIPDVFFHPRQALSEIVSKSDSTWLTPLMFLTLTAIILILIKGNLDKQAAMSGIPELPADYQYYTPEQQAQYMKSLEARQGPVFLYVIPGLAAVAGVWLGWLIVSGVLHLLLTVIGGRGDTGSALNLVAWSSLPLALRDLVRAFYMLATKTQITSPGLSGFVDPTQGNASLFLFSLLGLLDVYLVWYILLATAGARLSTRLPVGKAFAAVAISILSIVLVQALLNFGTSALGSLSVVRPFLF